MKENRRILILVAIGLVVLAAGLLLPPIQTPKVRSKRIQMMQNTSPSSITITNAMTNQQVQAP